jgi:Transposase DDE domain
MRRVSAAEQNKPLQPCEPRYGLRAGIEGTISEGLRCHGLRRARYRGQPKTQLQAKAIAAAINEGKHPSDVAKDSSWAPASTQASFVSVCTLATALGSMMSGQNFPAESFIHPLGAQSLDTMILLL